MSWFSWRALLTTRYEPDATVRSYLDRAQRHENSAARVTVAVPTIQESTRLFGVSVFKRGIQPVYLNIENLGEHPLRLQLVNLSPDYFTPHEAAALCHFSILKQLSKWGLLAWFFVTLIWLLPSKLITAWFANQRMDELFQQLALHLRPIPAGHSESGFVFTSMDAGTKSVHVVLQQLTNWRVGHSASELPQSHTELNQRGQHEPALDWTFTVPVPGMAIDHWHRDLSEIEQSADTVECDFLQLIEQLRAMPATTTNKSGTGTGDPVNLVMIGDYERLVSTFVARWDETESISLASCWRTAKAFLLGQEYRYSPVSSLYLFGRSQDIALQRARHSINERLHLRLWLTSLRYQKLPVWVGQISRDIGVRFTTKAWNLTTHRIDPDVDESRDYVFEDLLQAQRVESAGYIDGVGHASQQKPRHNLTGDPYFTDGKRAVLLLTTTRTSPRFVAWG